MTVLIPPILLLQIKKAENRQIPIMGGKRLGVRQEGSHLIRSSSFMTIKFLSFEFHALNLLPSIDTKPVSKSTDIRFVNSLNILFIQSILSFLKSEHVIPRFRVTTVFDVSQTDGKPLPEFGIEDLTASVENYEAFMQAITSVSPVPIRYDEIEGESHGYYHLVDKEIVIQSGMSESQTMKTAIHEVSHAKLHDREIMEELGIQKDKLTREVEALCSYFYNV